MLFFLGATPLNAPNSIRQYNYLSTSKTHIIERQLIKLSFYRKENILQSHTSKQHKNGKGKLYKSFFFPGF